MALQPALLLIIISSHSIQQKSAIIIVFQRRVKQLKMEAACFCSSIKASGTHPASQHLTETGSGAQRQKTMTKTENGNTVKVNNLSHLGIHSTKLAFVILLSMCM